MCYICLCCPDSGGLASSSDMHPAPSHHSLGDCDLEILPGRFSSFSSSHFRGECSTASFEVARWVARRCKRAGGSRKGASAIPRLGRPSDANCRLCTASQAPAHSNNTRRPLRMHGDLTTAFGPGPTSSCHHDALALATSSHGGKLACGHLSSALPRYRSGSALTTVQIRQSRTRVVRQQDDRHGRAHDGQ